MSSSPCENTQAVFRLPSPASSAQVGSDADLLTELPNRRQFRSHLQSTIDRAIRNRHQVWVLYVDIDRFNVVNTTHGHLFYSAAMDVQHRRSTMVRAQTQAKLASLTPREQEVPERLIAGEANKMIAYMLGSSMRTIEHHRAKIMSKAAAGSLPELVRMVLGQRDG